MGQSPPLHWQDYITVSDEWGAEEWADIIAVLNQLEPLYIMQETLRGIPQNKLFDWQPDKITLAPMQDDGFYEPFSRHILLLEDLKTAHRYLDEHNNEHRISLTRMILHELQHAIDPDLHAACLEALEIAKQDGVPHKKALSFIHHLIVEKETPEHDLTEKTVEKIRNSLLSRFWNENVVIGRVNPVMKEFFGEVPRAKFYMPIHQDEYEKYRIKPATPTKAYHIDNKRNVAEPLGDFLSDIEEEVRQSSSLFQRMIEERRDAAQYNFPGGNLRQ